MSSSEPAFVKRLSAEVNVLAFGADPTGVADCTAAFNAAIAECKTRNYSTLYVPAGKYLFTTTDTIPWITPPPAAPPQSAWQMIDVSGLCIRGDGALRSTSQENLFVGTTLIFKIPPTGSPLVTRVGLILSNCTGIRFENITFHGGVEVAGVAPARSTRAIGVRIESPNYGSAGIQFQNCAFQYCDVAVQTGLTNKHSELALYDCSFQSCVVGFQSLNNQALVQKFIGCTGGGNGSEVESGDMDVMFDLEAGGNITVVGFGGGNMRTFVRVGPGGPNIGWNNFYNVRLEEQVPFSDLNRMKIYDAIDSASLDGGQRSAFHGFVIVRTLGEALNVARFNLFQGHEVYVWNIGRSSSHPIATPAAPLLRFPMPELAERGGIFRCYGSNVPFDSRLDRDDVPPGASYSFDDCNEQLVPYPDRSHPPLSAPNYLAVAESHCWSVQGLRDVAPATTSGGVVDDAAPSDSARFGVIRCNTPSNGSAALVSHTSAMRRGGGAWRFEAAARVTAVHDETLGSEFSVRLGFGDVPSGEPDNGAYCRFVDQGNDNQWEGVLRWFGATPVVVDTNVTKDQSWHTFEIEVNPAGTVAEFYIDGQHVGTATNSIAQSDPLGLMPLQIVRVAGESAKGAEIDFFKFSCRPTVPEPLYPQ